jgi:hypothetical protein
VYAQVTLEFLYLKRDRRLADRELLGHLGEAAQPDYFQVGPQIVEVHSALSIYYKYYLSCTIIIFIVNFTLGIL